MGYIIQHKNKNEFRLKADFNGTKIGDHQMQPDEESGIYQAIGGLKDIPLELSCWVDKDSKLVLDNVTQMPTNTEIHNSTVTFSGSDTKISNSQINNSNVKLYNKQIENTNLKDCNVQNSTIKNSNLTGGQYASSTITESQIATRADSKIDHSILSAVGIDGAKRMASDVQVQNSTVMNSTFQPASDNENAVNHIYLKGNPIKGTINKTKANVIVHTHGLGDVSLTDSYLRTKEPLKQPIVMANVSANKIKINPDSPVMINLKEGMTGKKITLDSEAARKNKPYTTKYDVAITDGVNKKDQTIPQYQAEDKDRLNIVETVDSDSLKAFNKMQDGNKAALDTSKQALDNIKDAAKTEAASQILSDDFGVEMNLSNKSSLSQ